MSCWGLLLGLMAFVSSRIWFTSFVPAYSTYTWNSAVIAIGAAATIDKIISGKFPDQALTRALSKDFLIKWECHFVVNNAFLMTIVLQNSVFNNKIHSKFWEIFQ